MKAKNWCVYEHVFPNGKRYIGQTSMEPEARWNKGHGYDTQDKMRKAIEYYGWDNIAHHVIVGGLTRKQADELESYLIATLDTIRDGYNVAIGGSGRINDMYISGYLSSMIRAAMGPYAGILGGWQLVKNAYEARFDEPHANYFNEACDAVTRKWGEYSSTRADDVVCFWYHMGEYDELNLLRELGYDISEWFETYPAIEDITISRIDELEKKGNHVEQLGTRSSIEPLHESEVARLYGATVHQRMRKYGDSLEEAIEFAAELERRAMAYTEAVEAAGM